MNFTQIVILGTQTEAQMNLRSATNWEFVRDELIMQNVKSTLLQQTLLCHLKYWKIAIAVEEMYYFFLF